MTSRISWLLISPSDRKVYDSLVSGIEGDQFSSEVTSGFLIDSLRAEYLEGRFIERSILRERNTDPFGNEGEVERVEYRQLKFRLGRRAPHIELYDAPRQTHAFVNRLGEFTMGRVAIYSPEVSVSTLLSVLSKQAISFTAIGILLTEVEVDETVIAKVALSGTSDVRDSIAKILGKRAHRITQASGVAQFDEGSVRLIVRADGRMNLITGNEKVLANLRDCFRLAMRTE